MILFPLDLTDVTVLRLHQTFVIESSVRTACIFLAYVCVHLETIVYFYKYKSNLSVLFMLS